MLLSQKNARYLTIWMLLILGVGLGLAGLNVQAGATGKMRFQHLSPEDGLATDYVASTFRGSRGFLWLATRSGLNRYDGMEFVLYRHHPDDPHSISSDYINQIVEDTEGNLWVSTQNDGINRFDFATGRFTRYKHDPNDPNSLSYNSVRSMHVDRQGRLWVATFDGLSRLDPGSERFIRYAHNPADPASLKHSQLSYACDDPYGNIWVSGPVAGFNRLDPNTGRFTHYPHDPNNSNSPLNNYILTLHCAPDGKVWMGTYFGTSHFDPTTETFTHYQHDPNNPNSVKDTVARSITTDSYGALWLAMLNTGVSRFDPATEQFTHYSYEPHNPQSVSSNHPIHVYVDNSDMLWISSYNKVSYTPITPPRFVSYEYNPLLPNTLTHPIVSSVTSDANGEVIWLGLSDGGLNRLELATGELTTYEPDPADPTSLSATRVMAVKTAPDGVLWATSSDGLNRFDASTGGFVHYFEAPGKSTTDILGMDIDSKGHIWFTGTSLRGLFRFDPFSDESHDVLRNLDIKLFDNAESLTSYRADPNNPNGPKTILMVSVMVDSQDNVWVSTLDKGVTHLNTLTNQFTHYVADDMPGSLSSNKATMVYETHDGRIWVATNNGLNRLDAKTGRFKVYRTKDGLLTDDIVSIVEDLQGNLWLGTSKGLSRFDPVNETFRHFDRLDGLPGNSFYFRAAHRMPDGQILFGTRSGLATFYPKQVVNNPYKPAVFITDFQLFNESVSVGEDSLLHQAVNVTKKITLTHEQSVFSLKFAALNLLNPTKNQYAYKLHGFDSNWIYTDSKHRVATYTNLDAGHYTFQVKASNNDGVWNEDGASVELIILPPWWETLWFRIGIVLLVVLIIIAGVNWRLHAIDVQKKLLETQVQQRTMQLSKRTEELAQRTRQLTKLTQSLSQRTKELNIANHAIQQLNEQLKSENLRIGSELDVSKRMQQMLLPTPKELSELRDLDIAAFMESANEVGGDYYDVLTADDRVMIAIGDVTGHGLESGIMMLLIQAGVHTLLADGVHEPSHFIKTLNRMVHGNIQRMDSDKNLTLMLLDYKDGRVRFSGQHEELLWVSRTGKVQRIDTLELGFMMGLKNNIERLTEDRERQLQPGEGIVLYTDGITEAMNVSEAQYGIERLCKIVSEHWSESAEQIQQAVVQDLLSHLNGCKPLDDFTLVVVKRRNNVPSFAPFIEAAAG